MKPLLASLMALSLMLPGHTAAPPAVPTPVTRQDQVMHFTVRTDSLRQTSQGYWIVTIAAARTGLQSYVDRQSPTGWRVEFRSLEAITEPESFASWQHAPITIFHPREGYVDLSNSPDLKRGYVFDCPRIEEGPDGETYLLVDVLLDHPEAIDGVREGRLKEASAGYACLFVAKPGEYKGQKYDGLQISIRINHLSLLPEGMARAGRYATIRVDGEHDLYYFTTKGDSAMAGTDTPSTITLIQVRLDSKETVDLLPEQARPIQLALDARDQQITTLGGQVQTLTESQTSLQAQIQSLTDARDTEQGRADAAESQVTELQQQITQLKTDGTKTELKALFQTYLDVKDFLPEDFTLDGVDTLSARTFQEAALKAVRPDEDFSARNDGYVAAFAEALLKGRKPEPEMVPVGSGQPSPAARAMYRDMQGEPPAGGQREDAAPTGCNPYYDSLTETTRKRGF